MCRGRQLVGVYGAVFGGVVLLGLAAGTTRAADDKGTMTMGEVCNLGGAVGTDYPDGGYSCCWLNYGCLFCDASGACTIVCGSRKCCKKNELEMDENGECGPHHIFPEDFIPEEPSEPPELPLLSDLAITGEIAASNTPPARNDAPAEEDPPAEDDPPTEDDEQPTGDEQPLSEGVQEMFEAVGPAEDDGVDEDDSADEQIHLELRTLCGTISVGTLMFSAVGLLAIGRARRLRRAEH